MKERINKLGQQISKLKDRIIELTERLSELKEHIIACKERIIELDEHQKSKGHQLHFLHKAVTAFQIKQN